MIEIQKLLNRIHWDAEFGRGDFEVGIYDRVEDAVERIPLESLRFEKGNHFSFSIPTADGEWIVIPFHRVRNVYKNGLCIWNR
ncbi:MAG: DUF504 domain-containing protein [Kiritimatiellales bacterium]|nr:DUF504 domain-containing protein [Kiritimatiellales bacterium]